MPRLRSVPVYLVRHGETEWTRTRRHTGSSDVGLTRAGEAQAVALRQLLVGLHFDRVVVSPSGRSRRTAALAGFATPEVAPLLSEYDYGEYEGLTSEEIQARRPGWELWRDGCPGGESPQEVLDRARRLLSELALPKNGTSVLFGHGHVLRAVAAAYLGLDVGLCRHLMVRVASISVLDQEHGIPAIRSWDLV